MRFAAATKRLFHETHNSVERGIIMQHLAAASRELFKRTPDETFSSVAALSNHCQTQRANSAVHWLSPERLHAQAIDTRALVLAEGEDLSLPMNDWSFGQLCRLANVEKRTINRLTADTASRVFSETLPRGNKPLQVFTVDDQVRSIHGGSYRLVEGAEPSGFVAQKTSLSLGGLSGLEVAVIKEVESVYDKSYEVVTFEDGYCVYCSGSVIPKSNKKHKNSIEPNNKTFSSLLLSYPLVDISEGKIDVSDCKNKTCDKNNTEHAFEEVNKIPHKGMMVYFLQDFPWTAELLEHRSSIMLIVHKLHERRFVNYDGVVYEADDYIPLNREYMRTLDPNHVAARDALLREKILEPDGYYIIGEKSYSYRLRDHDLRNSERTKQPLNNKTISKRLRRDRQPTSRTHRWLISQLQKLAVSDIDDEFLQSVAAISQRERGGSIDKKIKSYKTLIGLIIDGSHRLEPDDQGRCYTLITNMKRELRSVLRVEGQPLQQIDIKNSQLTFLAVQMKQDGVIDDAYFEACEQGILYESIADATKSTRKKIKSAITQYALFSENDDKCQTSRPMRAFKRLYPTAWKYLYDQKDRNEGGSHLAKKLQHAEAVLMIDKVCGRLRRQGDIEFTTPIHDSLLFLPQDAERVEEALRIEFNKIGINPRLEIEDV
jgi:hypothetical protein